MMIMFIFEHDPPPSAEVALFLGLLRDQAVMTSYLCEIIPVGQENKPRTSQVLLDEVT